MPKNKGKGGKAHRKGKGGETAYDDDELVTAEPGQVYARVTRMLGGNRLEAACMDSKTRQATIRGAMRKKMWVATGDIVLLSLREYQDSVADVIYKYSLAAARKLQTAGELPASIVLADRAGADKESGDGAGAEDDMYEFGENSDDVDVDAI